MPCPVAERAAGHNSCARSAQFTRSWLWGDGGGSDAERERDAWMEERRERGVVSGAQRLTYMAYAAHRRLRLGSTRVSADRAISDGRVGLYMLCSVSTHRRGRTVEARSHARRVARETRRRRSGSTRPGEMWMVRDNLCCPSLASARARRFFGLLTLQYALSTGDFDDLTHGAWADPSETGPDRTSTWRLTGVCK